MQSSIIGAGTRFFVRCGQQEEPCFYHITGSGNTASDKRARSPSAAASREDGSSQRRRVEDSSTHQARAEPSSSGAAGAAAAAPTPLPDSPLYLLRVRDLERCAQSALHQLPRGALA